MKSLNIVFIGRLSFPNGIATTKRRRYIVDYLNKQDSSICCKVLGLRQKESIRFNNSNHGFYGKTEFVNLSELFYTGLFGKILYYYNAIQYINKWRKCKWSNIVIFQTNLEIELLPFFLCARILGYKVIFDKVEINYAQENTKNMSLKSKLYYKLNKFLSVWADKKANGFYVISTALLKQKSNEYPNTPICLLPNSTKILFADQKHSFGKPIKILYAGTFSQKDGVLFLIDAFIRLERIYSDIELILIGMGLYSDMQLVFESMRNNNKIKYLGFIDDNELEENLLAADILTMTRCNSTFANFGFPFKVTEYLATGNPILASKVSDIEKYLIDKESACLVEPEDSNSILEGLKFLIENESVSLKIGLNGLDVARNKFSIDIIGKNFVDFLNKLQ